MIMIKIENQWWDLKKCGCIISQVLCHLSLLNFSLYFDEEECLYCIKTIICYETQQKMRQQSMILYKNSDKNVLEYCDSITVCRIIVQFTKPNTDILEGKNTFLLLDTKKTAV